MTSPGAAASGPAGAPASLMTIGEVLGHLRPDFPDATLSKLRFLETEGLVEPRRTPAGYRKYTWEDVARLRYVLTAQRDHYLPLRVIREHLAAMDARAAEPGPGTARLSLVGPAPASGSDAVSGSGVAGGSGDPRASRADLIARTGITEPVLTELERSGLITARAGGWYDADAVAVAAAAVELSRFGLQPRHLRGWRAAADREIGLYAQLLAPLARQADPTARARAAELVSELVTLSQRLHGALLRAGLRDTLGQ